MAAITQKKFDPEAPKIRKLSEIPIPGPEEDNPLALFKNGWGRRKHFAMLVAPSGVGKSVISTQCAYSWALGKQAIIGSEPIRPMTIGIVQAEDDDTEMGEFRKNHQIGFKAEGWTDEDLARAEDKILDFSPVVRNCTGATFALELSRVLDDNPVDVLIMNPLQAYTNFNLNENDKMSDFLRQHLGRVLEKHDCMIFCVHHTNKPPTAKELEGWGSDATAAYMGAGGAELTNFSRSVTTIVPVKGVEGYFKLRGAKRGNRLGWEDADGRKTTLRYIAYSEDCIHWRIPDEAELAEKGIVKNSTAVAEAIDRKAKELHAETPQLAAERLAKAIRDYGELVGKTEATRLAEKVKVRRENRAFAVEEVFAHPHEHGLEVREGKDSRNHQILQLCAYGADVENHLEDMVP